MHLLTGSSQSVCSCQNNSNPSPSVQAGDDAETVGDTPLPGPPPVFKLLQHSNVIWVSGKASFKQKILDNIKHVHSCDKLCQKALYNVHI